MSAGGGLLALDVSSKRTGYAFGTDAGTPAPRASCWAMPGDGDLHRARAALATSIASLCGLIHPAVVVIEAPLQIFGRSAHTAFVLTALYGAASAAAHNSGAAVYDANVQTWRKHFTGQARPDNPKQATIDRCKLIGWEPKNDDEADAMGLWHWGMSTYFRHWRQVGTPLFRGAAA